MERRLRGRWSCSCSVSHGTSCVCDFQRVCVFRRLPRNISFCSAICHTFHKTTRQYFAIRLEDIRVFSMIWSDVRFGSVIMDKRDGCKHTSIRLMRVCCLSFEISIHNIIFKESNRKKIGYHVFGHGNTIVAYTLKQFCILYKYGVTVFSRQGIMEMACFYLILEKRCTFRGVLRSTLEYHGTTMVFWTYTCTK